MLIQDLVQACNDIMDKILNLKLVLHLVVPKRENTKQPDHRTPMAVLYPTYVRTYAVSTGHSCRS